MARREAATADCGQGPCVLGDGKRSQPGGGHDGRDRAHEASGLAVADRRGSLRSPGRPRARRPPWTAPPRRRRPLRDVLVDRDRRRQRGARREGRLAGLPSATDPRERRPRLGCGPSTSWAPSPIGRSLSRALPPLFPRWSRAVESGRGTIACSVFLINPVAATTPPFAAEASTTETCVLRRFTGRDSIRGHAAPAYFRQPHLAQRSDRSPAVTCSSMRRAS